MKLDNGIALITVLLVVFMASVSTIAVFQQLNIGIEQTKYVKTAEQAYQYAQGLELWAKKILIDDQAGLPNGAAADVDSRGEPWATPIPPLTVVGGYVSGELIAADGCININGLLSEQFGDIQLQRLKRLLSVLNVEETTAMKILDWVDVNSVRNTEGAEDYVYFAKNPSYRAANQAMMHVSELKLIDGVNQELFQILKPHVCVLSIDAPLNINMATIPVLMALAENLSEYDAEKIYNEGQAAYQSVAELIDEVGNSVIINPANLDVKSHFFLAHGVVELNNYRHDYYSMLKRITTDKVITLQRTKGQY